ncbi:MAG: thioredoxin domain-containing protein [Myxococcota bacterium]|nr:thioredoxin domain-containing protein [Myxococcota bacterium]
MLLLLLSCAPAPAPQWRTATADEREGPWRNRLADEESPYLRMHAADPVNWWPWGAEAFAEAARRDVPVFLSIGYFACHWCHVMHHESFSDPATAAVLNAGFVSIKVDREERPDIDAVYMDALNALAGRGGWPASLWLTPERVPIYGGTYYPPERGRSRPGFVELLGRISERWSTEREKITALSDTMLVELAQRGAGGAVGERPGSDEAAGVLTGLVASWDPEHLGWGGRTQFPMTPRLQFMSSAIAASPDSPERARAESVLRRTLDAIESGGLYDHLGGGFHRYTIDIDWRVPHFEKMLYDNGQLLGVYAEAALLLGEPGYRRVVAETVDFLERDLRHSSGAFYSSLGADSEGEEGTHYVWTPDQIAAVLADPRPFLDAYPVQMRGNFEGGRTVLARRPEADPAPLVAQRAALLAARQQREAPPTDTKRIVAWNGLTISGLARAGRLLDEPRYIALAEDAAAAVLSARADDGSLPRILGDDTPGVLADYAFTIEGLLDLFEATGQPRWLAAANGLAAVMIARLYDPDDGGFFESTATDLPVRRKDLTDGAEPAASGRAGLVMLRLWRLGAPAARLEQIEALLSTAGSTLQSRPTAAPTFGTLADLRSRPSREVIIAADDPTDSRRLELLARFNARPRPDTALAPLSPADRAMLAPFAALIGKSPGDDGVRAFVCSEGVCEAPTSDPEVFSRLLENRR